MAAEPGRLENDAAAELGAALHSAALADRSDLGRLTATGKDILDLLHRLTTQDLRTLAPGEGREAVLTSPKGRIVERIFVHHLGAEGALLVCGPGGGPRVHAHLARYTFAEDTGIQDATEEKAQLVVLGPRARAAGAGVGPLPPRLGAIPWDHPAGSGWVLGHDGFSADGLSWIVPRDRAPAVREVLLRAVTGSLGREIGRVALEAWRVLRGHPSSGSELTEEHNPLEAGLWDAVSFTKGCYVGQEVVARLRTYDKVSRRLAGLVFADGVAPPPAGAAVLREGVVGRVTSALLPPARRAPVALAYLKRQAAEPGTSVSVETGGGALAAKVVTLPFEA